MKCVRRAFARKLDGIASLSRSNELSRAQDEAALIAVLPAASATGSSCCEKLSTIISEWPCRSLYISQTSSRRQTSAMRASVISYVGR